MQKCLPRRSGWALSFLALAPLFGSCGGDAAPSVAPVEIPPDFSKEAQVQNLLTAKYAAAQKAPSDPARHLTLGLAFVANGAGDLGEQSFRKALELDPNHTEARYQLALTLGARGALDDQIQELRRVIELDAAFFPAHYALGCALLDQGQLSEAAKSFEAVKTGQGPTRMGELGLGLVALEREDPRAALPLLAAAAKKYPSDQFIRFQMGQAYRDLGEDDRASKILATVEDAGGRPSLRSPGTAESAKYAVNRASQVQAAVQRIGAGNHTAAISILKKLYENDPQDLAVANNLNAAYVGAGQLDAALRVVDKAIAQAPDQYPAHLNRAATLLEIAERTRQKGQVPESRENLLDGLGSSEEAVRLAPRLGRAQLLRGQLLAALGRDEESLGAFRAGIDLGEVQESTFVDMQAPMLRSRGPLAAEELLREGLKHGGARPHIRFLLCGILIQSGRGAESRAEQQELARLAPNHPYAKRAGQMLTERGY